MRLLIVSCQYLQGSWDFQLIEMGQSSLKRNQWENVPFAPKRWPFFYGWVITAVCTICTIASIPGQTMGVGVFTDSLISALKLSRTELSTAYMIGTIASSFLIPFAGQLLDRIGARSMVVLVSIGLGISLVLLSLSGEIALIGGTHSVISSIVIISFCFLLLRFFGQGCLTMVPRVTIGRWFNYRRGLATGISGVFVSFGFNSSPTLLNWMLETFSWRSTCMMLAVSIGIGMTILGWIFFRDNPEDCGLTMDNITDENHREKLAASVPEIKKEFTRGEAIKTLSFWAFSLGQGMVALIVTAVTFHISSIGEEMGLNRAESYALFLPMTIFSVSSNFFFCWISDRVRHKWLLLVMMIAQALDIIAIMFLDLTIGRALFIVCHGISIGTFVSLSTVVFPRFFGRLHLGAISGLNFSIMVFASAVGPVFFSTMHGLTGSYRTASMICLFIPIAIAIISPRANNPQLKIDKQVSL